MGEFILARPNGRKIPREDKIFGISNRAKAAIAEKGRAGETYNVGSGKAYSAGEILDRLIAMAKCPIPVRQDPSRMRPSDTPVIRCDHSKVTRDTGWEPELSLETILADTLEYYRSR